MGKIIGGGFPVGATGGKAEVMAVFDPGTRGPRILSGGTFSANPVTMTAGLAAMQAMDHATFARLEDMGARLRQRLNMVNDNGLGCLSTPMSEAELDRIETALERALATLAGG